MDRRCLVELVASDRARTRLTCFPFAGANVRTFSPWAAMLPRDIALCAVEYPGHGTRRDTAPAPGIDALAEEAADALQDMPPMRNVLFGYSFGALAAFEAARRLERRQADLALLIVAAAPPPRAAPPPMSGEDLSDEAIRARARATGMVAAELLDDPYFGGQIISTLRADWAISARYHAAADAVIRVPIIAYGGLGDAAIGRDDLAGWSTRTSAGCITRMVPGGHDFLRESPAMTIDAVVRDIVSRT